MLSTLLRRASPAAGALPPPVSDGRPDEQPTIAAMTATRRNAFCLLLTLLLRSLSPSSYYRAGRCYNAASTGRRARTAEREPRSTAPVLTSTTGAAMHGPESPS